MRLLHISVTALLILGSVQAQRYTERRVSWPESDLVVCDGDSITAGVGSENGLNYPTDLQEKLALSRQRWTVANTAVSGQSLDSAFVRAPSVVDSLLSRSYAHNVVVIFAGTNDIELKSQTAEHVYATEQAYGVARHLNSVPVSVIVVDMLPRAAGDEARRAKLNSLLSQDFPVPTPYNNVWLPAGPIYADCFIDVASDTDLGRFQANMSESYYSPDHIHLNNAGYRLLANYVYNALQGLNFKKTGVGKYKSEKEGINEDFTYRFSRIGLF